MDPAVIWYVIVGVLFAGFVLLDGYDLGIGVMHLLVREKGLKNALRPVIAPVWDGNEVWLVVGGGALFAAFPVAYANVFSSFYTAFMLFLFAVMFRAASIELAHFFEVRWWQVFWDLAFGLSSLVLALLLGVAMGNLVAGLPLDADGIFRGGLRGLLRPYPLMTGLTALVLLTLHGAAMAALKCSKPFDQTAREWVLRLSVLFVGLYAILTFWTLRFLPHMSQAMREYPALFLIPFLTLLSVVNIPHWAWRGNDRLTLLSTSFTILGLLALFGAGMFPNLVLSVPEPSHSLTLWNSSSSDKTQFIMLVITAMGMPLVIAYQIAVHWIFRGRISPDDSSY
ncbi:MAG: cytochrome d ubiquinol oxidase subunit II [Candidatus Omnitrophica bacterium]|nr:cytochrome d ubiquinol oxidase subunit II [Candidatus Omnitrophota bacterium]